MGFQRARSKDQIQDRIQEIIDAAASIYNLEGYEGLNFSAISEHTKFTRPNIYKYFKTKDEILLVILKEDMKLFVSSLLKSFRLNKCYSLHEITEIWTAALLEHERFLDLFAVLFTLIEKNVSVSALAEFKKEVLTAQMTLFDLVAQLYPKADSDSVKDFINAQFTLAFGLYPMTKLTGLQLEAIQLSGMDYKPLEFKKAYKASFYQLIYCLENGIAFNVE